MELLFLSPLSQLLYHLYNLNTSMDSRRILDSIFVADLLTYISTVTSTVLSLDRSPLPKYVKIKHVTGYPMLVDPDMYHQSIETPGQNYSTPQSQSSYLSFAPPEV